MDECPPIYIMQQHTIATEALLLTQVRCVAYLDYLVPVMAGIHHQAASLPHSLSSLSRKIGHFSAQCITMELGGVCYGTGQTPRGSRVPGNVMKHTLETDHTDIGYVITM